MAGKLRFLSVTGGAWTCFLAAEYGFGIGTLEHIEACGTGVQSVKKPFKWAGDQGIGT